GTCGGPLEFGVSGYLIKSFTEPWDRDSIMAIDAGTFMSGILYALRPQGTSLNFCPPSLGPQKLGTGTMPFNSPLANAAHVVRELVSAVCITHAHLDHVSGFVLNSSCFTPDRPKVLAGIPRVIDNIKTHLFNNVIWPNLSDEGENSIGLVRLRRLHVDESAEQEQDPEKNVEADEEADDDDDDVVEISDEKLDEGYEPIANGVDMRAFAISHGCVHVGASSGESATVNAYDSTAFFIRDRATGKEILVFGDVEPDTVSVRPKNKQVWVAAASKFGRNKLAAIFIECSYSSIQPEHSLFGHLSPPYLIQELKTFAS
ncbi:cAMP phosphodiesterases class-II-domain-containing protein, partial [Lipomyces japonicus]|uniref:cAMP phosphodiesterases class-II-domain-containing protein n=1 Tax=Lipomyces japonicus TaxID=56871 RepID=UPI0034CF3B5E